MAGVQDLVVTGPSGAPMLLSSLLLISREVSGTEVLAILFAAVLGILLIRDAQRDSQTLHRRDK